MDATERTMRGLRDQADRGTDVPAEHVRAVLSRFDRAGCVALCGRLGIVRRVRTRTDAVEAVVRWVLAGPLARQAIAY